METWKTQLAHAQAHALQLKRPLCGLTSPLTPRGEFPLLKLRSRQTSDATNRTT